MQVSAPSFAATLKMVEREAAVTQSAEEAAAPDMATMLEDFVRNAAETRKQFATDRLKHLKEQMNTLLLFSNQPGVLKNLSSQFAKELEGAATDFSRAIRTLADNERDFAPETSGDAYLEINEDFAPKPVALNAEDRETANGFTSTAQLINGLIDLSRHHDDKPNDRRQSDRAHQSVANVVSMMTRLDGKGLLDPVFL